MAEQIQMRVDDQDMSWFDYLDTAALIGTFVPGLSALKGVKALRAVLGIKQAIDSASFISDKTGFIHLPDSGQLVAQGMNAVKSVLTDQVVVKGHERLDQMEGPKRDELVKSYNGDVEAASRAVGEVAKGLERTVPAIVASGVAMVLMSMRHRARLVVAPAKITVRDMLDYEMTQQVIGKMKIPFLVVVFSKVSEFIVLRDFRRGGSQQTLQSAWDAQGGSMLYALSELTDKDISDVAKVPDFVVARLAQMVGA